jgi:hypothetical protein
LRHGGARSSRNPIALMTGNDPDFAPRPTMNTVFRALVPGVLLMVIATTASAQSPATRTAAFEGVVRDESTGRPMQKTWVCAMIHHSSYGEYRCAPVDSTGAYRLDSLPATGLRVDVGCETLRTLMQERLATDSVDLLSTERRRRDWTVSSVRCDPRPIRRVTGIFRGHYTPGFESSEFVPCAADAWFIPGDSLGSTTYDDRRAWAEWKPGLMKRVNWPRLPRDEYGNSRYYVRWRATVVGPGRYGHMGVSAFEIRVDSVLDLRAPTNRDCR